MSGSGNKRELVNPRERAVSTDINRLQAFAAADMAELFRQWLEPVGYEPSARGASIYTTTTTAPLRAVIFGGLLVRPQLGSVNTLVDAGSAYVVDPDAAPSPDDSVFKLVTDPGVVNGSSLPLVPNSSGSTRVDIVECSRVDTVLETDNRDIYDETTGLFTPVSVNKVMASRFQYRIRSGTPGAGIPALASGWLPLMIAVVPTGTAVWGTGCTFYDVRPLANESANGSTRAYDAPRPSEHFVSLSAPSTAIQGYCVATFGPWKAGGVLGGVDALGNYLGFDIATAANKESGFAYPNNRPVYVYACFPAGLPRWVKYSPVGIPAGTRGVLQLSTTMPTFYKGQTVTPITLNSALGLGATAVPGVCLTSFMTNNSSPPGSFICDGKTTWEWSNTVRTVAPTVLSTTLATFNIQSGVNFPMNAIAIYVRYTISWTSLTSPTRLDMQIEGYEGTGTSVVVQHINSTYHPTLVADIVETAIIRLPVDQQFPLVDGGLPRSYASKITFTQIDDAGGIVGYAAAEIVGWDVAP